MPATLLRRRCFRRLWTPVLGEDAWPSALVVDALNPNPACERLALLLAPLDRRWGARGLSGLLGRDSRCRGSRLCRDTGSLPLINGHTRTDAAAAACSGAYTTWPGSTRTCPRHRPSGAPPAWWSTASSWCPSAPGSVLGDAGHGRGCAAPGTLSAAPDTPAMCVPVPVPGTRLAAADAPP